MCHMATTYERCHYTFITVRNPKGCLQSKNLSSSMVVMTGHDNHRTQRQLRDWRSQLQMNLIRQTRPFSKMSLSKCPRHWQGHQDYLIPPIMPRTVTKPAMQIVRSTLKPHYWAEGVTKEGINTTIPPTTARIQGNTYKALTLPIEGRETHWEIFLALLHCIIFS